MWILCILAANTYSWGQSAESLSPKTASDSNNASIELIRYEDEFSFVRLKLARMDSKLGLAIIFDGTGDLHYYANPETAPAVGFELKVEAKSDDFAFSKPVFPKWSHFYDSSQEKQIEVYVGDFTVFIPIHQAPSEPAEVSVTITGLACTSQICLQPFTHTVLATYDPQTRSLTDIRLKSASIESTSDKKAPEPAGNSALPAVLPYSEPVYFLLAILAGLSINIMPCVLPVIPLIIMRLLDQSKKGGGKHLVSGMAFCGGIILFFTAFALIAALINISTGAVLDINSLFRYPVAVIVLFLAIVLFGLVMLDVIAFFVPSSIANKQGSSSSIASSIGMGFFAGILSTPCSGALLGFVLVWAQTQPLLVSSTAIILMGFGMALPYAILVSIPSLLEKVPKPGTWMEIFKKSCGFLLFFIAVKLTLAALPKDRLIEVLTYGVIFSFCVWMWGKWVSFSTPAAKKWAVRLTALVIAIATGFWLLPATAQQVVINWQQYNARVVELAKLQDRPILIKFTADWCTNCKIVDKKVYQDRDVAKLIEDKNVLAIKADTTLIDYPATVDLKQIYGEAGNVPVTIVILPGNRQQKIRGIFKKDILLAMLGSLPDLEK